MADTETTNYGLTKPEIGSSLWGAKINTNLDSIDTEVKSVSDTVDGKAATVHTHVENDLTDLTHTDSDAVHVDEDSEISGVAAKATVVDADILLIEDSASSYSKKKVTVATLISGASGSGTDSNAVHVNVVGEINAISAKTTVVNADLLLLEDSANSYNKKKVTVANLVAAASTTDSDAVHVDEANEISGITAKAVVIDADILLIEDSANSYSKKKVTVAALISGAITATDSDAIHVNVAEEINGLNEITEVHLSDIVILEDSANSFAKGKSLIQNIQSVRTGSTVAEFYEYSNTSALEVLHSSTSGTFVDDGITSGSMIETKVINKFTLASGTLTFYVGAQSLVVSSAGSYLVDIDYHATAYDDEGTDTLAERTILSLYKSSAMTQYVLNDETATELEGYIKFQFSAASLSNTFTTNLAFTKFIRQLDNASEGE